MTFDNAHAALYVGMPEGTIINICERSADDARLVSANCGEVAQALGLTGEAMEAARAGDTWHIDSALSARFRALIAEYGLDEEE